jgi:hypothetical protein
MGEDEKRITERGERDKEHAVWEARKKLLCDSQSKARFANPSRACERQQTRITR